MDYCVICGDYCEEGTMVCVNCLAEINKDEGDEE